VGVIDTAYFLLYAKYGENEYILTKYNSNPAVRPRPGRFKVHDFERGGLPLPSSPERMTYVIFRWNQQYDEILALMHRSLTDIEYKFERHELAVPGSTFRYVAYTFTIPIESVARMIERAKVPPTGTNTSRVPDSAADLTSLRPPAQQRTDTLDSGRPVRPAS
jgi:hypothetical protein